MPASSVTRFFDASGSLEPLPADRRMNRTVEVGRAFPG